MAEYLISLSLLICAVLLIRGIFRKTISPRVVYALWLVVVIRMFLPIALFEVNIEAPAFLQRDHTEQSEMPDIQTEAPGTSIDAAVQTSPTYPVQNPAPTYPEQNPSPVTPITPTIPETDTPASMESVLPEDTVNIAWGQIAGIIWLAGSVVVAAWVMTTSISFNYRLYKDRKLHRTVRGAKVYVSGSTGVPCIAGLIPSIYITPEAADSGSEMLIIVHEHIHLRHGDHIWTIVRAMALIVFWWNPLVWVAATVSKQDAELACDDAIAAKLDDETRLKYAHILLDTIPQKRRYAVGFGSAPMKERILMLTEKQKNRWLCLVLAVVLTVSAVGCSFIGQPKPTLDNIEKQKGFTILSQQTKEIVLTLPVDELPAYGEVEAAHGTELDMKDIAVYRSGITTVVLKSIGILEHEPTDTMKDTMYLSFDIVYALTDAATICTVHRVMNADNGITYASEFLIPDGTVQDDRAVYEHAVNEKGSGPSNHFAVYMDTGVYTQLKGNASFRITLNEIVYKRGSETKIYDRDAAENDTNPALKISSIAAEEIQGLPYAEDAAILKGSPVGNDLMYYIFEAGLTYYRYDRPTDKYHKCVLPLPEGYTDGEIIFVSRGGGSGELDMTVEATYEGERVWLDYFFYTGDSSEMLQPASVSLLDETQRRHLAEIMKSDEPTSAVSHGPFIGYVADAETPWIELYTEKDGGYVGRIPYEIFHDWVATDRSSESWTPGWEPEYIRFYYAEFGNFRWAAAHLTNTVLGSGRKNVATSSDGGETWTVGSTSDDYGGNHVVGIGFVSDKTAFMSFDPYNEYEETDGPVISRTVDGGKTWERLEISVPESLQGKKLISGIPFYDGDVLRYPVWVTLSHGSTDGEARYLVSYDNGLTWEWEIPTEAGLSEYRIVWEGNEELREYLANAASYGESTGYAYGNTIHPGTDGVRYEVFGVGSHYKKAGKFSAYQTYRVTSRDGYILSVEEAETITKETVLQKGKPYAGTLDGLYSCKSFHINNGGLIGRSILVQGDTMTVSAYLDGTDAGGTYEGTYTYDANTGILSANLKWMVYENGGISVSDPLKLTGKLYEYGGFVHFVCESSDMKDISPDDPLPLTFVPNTDGSANPPAVVLDNVVNGEWYYGFSDENGMQFYRLTIDAKTAQMQFDYGFYESEYVNRYAGSYTINPLSQEITALLRDSSEMHSDPEINIKFYLGYFTDSNGITLIWDVLSCNVPKYQHLAGRSLEFVREMPSIVDLSSDEVDDSRIYTIPTEETDVVR